MGKSKKKPFIVDYNKGAKQTSHKVFRNKVKQIIRNQDFENLPKDERQFFDEYNICDFRIRWSKETDRHLENLGYNEEEIAKNKRKYTNK